ncbi:MAG: amylo-alpha-1,6-glucosidase [Elusimicrobiota bacterium]
MDQESPYQDARSRRREWLETDGRGGFASGTAQGARSRRYHGLLICAAAPPSGRVVLVNGFDAWAQTSSGLYALSSQHYPPDILQPDGFRRIKNFVYRPWPRWTFALEDGSEIGQEIFIAQDSGATVVSWRLIKPREGVTLSVRPFLSGRDYHALHRENQNFRFDPEPRGHGLLWRPYPGVPAIAAAFNGVYSHAPLWYRQFLYEEEKNRGLDCVEDLAAPGVIRWDLSSGPAFLILAAENPDHRPIPQDARAQDLGKILRDAELARRQKGSPLRLAAQNYLVRRGSGLSVIAGYPWFTDWGRDTFVSMRGLLLSAGRFAEALSLILEWTGSASEGMIPNRFPDDGGAPEYTSVDSTLWMIVAAGEFLRATEQNDDLASEKNKKIIADFMETAVSRYAAGARWGIKADADGLLACGEPGRTALTWMDARVNGAPVTPRVGKPVEVQALWINALAAAGLKNQSWRALEKKARDSFLNRFWNTEKNCLFDVVDADHKPGSNDGSLRPNQIFAVGGLPSSIVEGSRAKAVVDAVERRLWTPLGLRSLAPGEPGYQARYEGNVAARDGAYHQGTAWPWLLGAFVQAWVRVRGGGRDAKLRAREKFLAPLIRHLEDAGLGHISEISDAEPPFTPRGCPFQAWSVGEALRLELSVLSLKNQSPSREMSCK